MKHTTLKTYPLLGIFVMLAAVSVSAQTSGQMRVSIPFDFVAGKTSLKAGNYEVSHSAQNILMLRGLDETKGIFVSTVYTIRRPAGDPSCKLVFHRYGDNYFLTEAWTSEEPNGSGLNSKAERRLARELAKTKTPPQSVEIVARAN